MSAESVGYALADRFALARLPADDLAPIWPRRGAGFASGRPGIPADLRPTYDGDSVAHWEGNTLVVDTIGYNDLGMGVTPRQVFCCGANYRPCGHTVGQRPAGNEAG